MSYRRRCLRFVPRGQSLATGSVAVTQHLHVLRRQRFPHQAMMLAHGHEDGPMRFFDEDRLAIIAHGIPVGFGEVRQVYECA